MNQGFHRILIVPIILLLAVVACNAPTISPGASATSVPPTDQPTPTTPEQVTRRPSNLDERPLVWFAPLPLLDEYQGIDYTGSLDYMDLFVDGAAWETTASHVGVFNLYGFWVAYFATDEELRQLVAGVNSRGLALGLEAEPLPSTSCGGGIEGFKGQGEEQIIARRIQEAGGEIKYIAFDAPYVGGHLNDGPNSCQWPADRVARHMGQYVASMRATFPDVIVGDTEPLWIGLDENEYKSWIDTYEQVNGEPLAFFHLDVEFAREGWAETALDLEHYMRDRGVEFGIFYLGDYDDTSDAQWLEKAAERMVIYESLTGGQPDHVLFQSWHDHPDYSLPETQPDTYTHLVNSYFRTRTSLTVEPEWVDNTSAVINATLMQEDGAPVAGQPVALTVSPLDGSGVPGEYTVTGIVPEGATHGNVGIRVNMECDCSAPSEFSLYGVSYSENGGGNLVPNPSFAAGMNNWGTWGSINPLVQPSDQGSGSMLHVTATPGQSLGVNGGDFPVTPGASFELTFTARVAPESVGSGYFAVFFLTPSTEVSRVQIALEPAAAAEVSATTGSDGGFSIPMSSLPPGSYQVDVSFAGDDQLWPALTQAVLPPR